MANGDVATAQPAEPQAEVSTKVVVAERPEPLDLDAARRAVESEHQRQGTTLVERSPSPGSQTPTLAQFNEMLEIATVLLETEFLPVGLQTPGQVVAVILTGQELGVPMMQAVRLIQPVKGKPTSAAELMLALFMRAGGRIQWQETNDRIAQCKLVRPNGDEYVSRFTSEMAKRAGLIHDRLKPDAGWAKYREAMLRARAISSGLRAFAPDVIGGLYTAEELGAEFGTTGSIEMIDGEPVEPMTAERPISTAQEKLIKRLMASHVWTQDEKDRVRDWLSEPRQWHEAHDKIQEITAELGKRKAVERDGGGRKAPTGEDDAETKEIREEDAALVESEE